MWSAPAERWQSAAATVFWLSVNARLGSMPTKAASPKAFGVAAALQSAIDFGRGGTGKMHFCKRISPAGIFPGNYNG
jgi:hypothetical protein